MSDAESQKTSVHRRIQTRSRAVDHRPQLYGNQQTATVVLGQVLPEGLLKELETLSAVGKVEFSATEVCLRADTDTMFDFAHVDSNDQQTRLLNIHFPRFGVSSILFQSHEIKILF